MPQLKFDDLPEVNKKNTLTFEDLPTKRQQDILSFDDLPDVVAEKISQPQTTLKSDYPLTRQYFKQVFQQAPFGKRVLSAFPEREQFYATTPPPVTIPEKIAAGAGSLTGAIPSFAIGGLAGKPVGAVVTLATLPKLGRLAKYTGAIAGGAVTFPVARVLRNIAQNRSPLEGVPEEAKIGAMWGPTGQIRSLPNAIAASAGLGAMTAPEGEKLPSAILFGGLTALFHQKPDFSKQDKLTLDALYNEALTKEGIRAVKERMVGIPLQLPEPKTIYGEGFTATRPITKLPVFEQKQITGQPSKQLIYQPTLSEGAIRQGTGFEVVGGKMVRRPIAKAQAQELRTTPTAELVTQTAAQQASVKTPQVEATSTPVKSYFKIKLGEQWKTGGYKEGGKFYASQKMTSEKAIKIIKKSLKNYTQRTKGDYLIIEGEGGFTTLDFLNPIKEISTNIYRGIEPPSELLRNDKQINSIIQERQRKIAEVKSGTLPQSLLVQRLKEINDSEKAIIETNQSGGKDESIIVTKVTNAIDMERMFVNKFSQILQLADKVGITKDSKASEIIFKVLDYSRAQLEEIAQLTPDQKKFIPIFKNAFKDIWQATGKPSYEGVRDYVTHLVNDGLEKGYDVSPLGRHLPDELYSRFFEKRKFGKPYKQDIIEAFDTYVPNVARKIFREPVLQEFNQLAPHLGVDYKNEAVDYMEAFLGRGRYAGEEVLGSLPRDLVRLTYRGTLYGNLSAATKNATQVLTNTLPEIGAVSTLFGYKKLMTPAGRKAFIESGLAGEVTLGKPIDQLDFFSQVEFVNRGVTYLGAKYKALSEGKSLIDAELYAKKIVRKTQFIQTGTDVPKLYRRYGAVGRMVGQFVQFPTKQGFLIWNWARLGQWDKVARFATITYLLGGSRAFPFLDGIIDGDYKQLPQIPDDIKKLIRNVEKYSSLAGISGIDIGQNFGFGIYSRGVPLGRGPALGLFKELGGFVKAVKAHEITNLQDIIRSRLIQKSLPTLIKGGVAGKKIIDLINLDLNDYKIKNAYNNLQYTSSPEEEVIRILVGPTKERKEAWESVRQQRTQDEIYKNEHRKMLDYILDSKGDTMGLEEFLKKNPTYNINNLPQELIQRAKNREMPANIREFLRRPKALRLLQE